MSLAIDILLASGLLLLAWQVVTQQRLFRSIVMFIVFGLVMALCWARLNAPDLALAEAAIGAGLTGALLLAAYQRLHADRPGSTTGLRDVTRRGQWLALTIAILSAVLVGVVGWAALELAVGRATAGALVGVRLAETGLGNPVTGVLLVFRNYDTLLEMAVLLIALIGARAIAPPEAQRPLPPEYARLPLVTALLAFVVPLGILAAVYLLKAGADEPGGAFQAGAVLAATGVLLCLTGRLRPQARMHMIERIILVAGLLIFCAVGVGSGLAGHGMMTMPGLWSIFVVEFALMLSIALPLVLLFAGADGLRRVIR